MSTTSPSSYQGICLAFEEAINQLPEFMQPKDEHEHDQLDMFLSQVDDLHKPDGRDTSATSIFNYIKRILESAPPEAGEGASQQGILTRSEAFERLPKLPDQLPSITESIAGQIASDIIHGYNPHTITISLLDLLKRYSWETKVALTTATYILTFGDFGQILSPKSNLSLNNMPMFVKQLLEITNCIVEFEKLPKLYMTLMEPNVKEARTHFIVGVYWVIKAIMDNYASHIRTYRFGKAISPPWDEKLEAITNHLKIKLHLLEELLAIDIEAYRRIKKFVNQEDHKDNLEVLNVLISSGYDRPQLYDGSAGKRVYLNELEGKYVLLLITNLDVNHYDFSIIHQFHAQTKERLNYELVFIPFVDPARQLTYSQMMKYEKLRSLVNWYVVDQQWMVKREVIKFIGDDWKFEGEPIIVVLDPQGKVVNQNAFPMMLIWLEKAFPFSTSREETLWNEQTWRLDLLIHGIEPLFSDLMIADNYIILYGGTNLLWVEKFTKEVKSISDAMLIPIEMFFVTNNDDEPLTYNNLFDTRRASNVVIRSNRRCLPGQLSAWFFWRRIESMIYSMVRHGKINSIFQEIQRLHNYNKSNTDWAILAKGSKILVVGNGNVVLDTLKQHEVWKEKAYKEGFEVGFMSHYQELYRREHFVQRIELPAMPLDILNTPADKAVAVHCPDCHSQMKLKHFTFVCDHPSWKN